MFKAKALSGGLLVVATVLCAGACDRAQANEIFESTLQLDVGTTAEVQVIQNLIQEKQFDKAMNAVEALEKEQPNNPTTFNLKGAVYLGKNDVANARKSFERALKLESNSIAAAMNLAQLDVEEGNPEAARRRFQGILAKDKTNAQAMMGLAGLAAATAHETEYVAWLEKAAEAGPSLVRPRILLADYYLRKNDAQKALTMAQEALTANPDNVQVMELLGTAQIAAGETKNAVTTYDKLSRLSPNDPVVHYKLATAQAASQSIAAAVPSLKKALELKPDYAQAEIMLAYAEIDAGRYGIALKIAQQLQKQDPKSASGLALQGDILMAQKQFAPALTAYARALEINKTGVLVVKAHMALSAGGNRKEADARLLQWLKDQPNDVVARDYLAATYMKAGQYKQAIEQYQLLLVTDPKNGHALNNLAWLYQQEKDPRALATAEQAYLVNSDGADIMDTLGWLLVEQGNTTRAVELLQKATERAPASTGIRYHWAVALARAGDNPRARKELEDLLAKNKTFPERKEAQALLKQLPD